jgi:hypothetical protein
VGESHAFPDRLTAVRQARVAGACYLLLIAGGVFAALFVREPLFVPGDPTATASGIAANEALWRWGIAVHALYLLAGSAFAVILYGLFRAVEATLARLALVLMMSDVAIEAVLLTSLYVPLAMMEEAPSRWVRWTRASGMPSATWPSASSSPAGASGSCSSPASAWPSVC